MKCPETIRHGEVEGLRVGRVKFRNTTTAICYRIGSTLLDTGPANQWSKIRAFVDGRPLGQVLLTHHHEDHSGNAARLQARTRATVFEPADALERLAAGFHLYPYQHLFWGRPRPVIAQALSGEIELDGGLRLRVLAAPGHSTDHVCFLEPDRGWLFSGDLFVGSKLRYLRRDEELFQLIASLRTVLAQDFDTLFCGHRGVVVDAHRAMQEKLTFIEELREHARALHTRGQPTAHIVRELLGKEDSTRWITGGHFSKRNLIEACLALDEEVFDERIST